MTKLMNGYGLNAKFIDRKRGYLVYLKTEKISTFKFDYGYQALKI